ncbi:MAG: hypothetical protein GWP91_22435 [Rhodobacterales bacterium]|nr:hypothetical protein [Rhodobacterales bacterium]
MTMILWLCTLAFSGPSEVAIGELMPLQVPADVKTQVISHGGAIQTSGFGPRGASVLLTHRIDDLPVDLSGAVWLRADGTVRARRALEEFPIRKNGPVISVALALQIASERVVAWSPHARLSWQEIGGELRRVWSVEFDRSADARFVRPTVRIDAETGRVLNVDGLSVAVDPLARVYPHSPTVDGETVQVSLPLAVEGLVDERVSVHQCLDLQDVESQWSDGEELFFHVCTQMPAAGPVDGNYFSDEIPYPTDPGRDEDVFVAANLYWSVNQGLDWFIDLGWEPLPDFDPFLEVTANSRETDLLTLESATDPTESLYPYDNAYSAGGYEDWEGNWVTARLVFGQGREIDYGYDGDVIHHELAHFIVRSQNGPWWSRDSDYGPRVDGGAINEGLADYFSSVIHGDPLLGEYSAGYDRSYIRTLDGDATCYDDLLGEVHFDSQPFAQGLWTFRAGLLPTEARILDELVLDSLVVLGANPKFSDIYEVLTDAVEEDLGDEVADRLRAEWQARGLPDCLPIQYVLSDAEDPARIYTPVPYFTPYNNVGPIPGPLQFVVDAPEAGATVTVRLSQREFLGLDPLGTNIPVEPTVISKSGEQILWEKQIEEHTFTADGTEVEASVLRWKHDAQDVGRMAEVGTSEHSSRPERYRMHHYELTFLADQAGPVVFQFANDNAGYTLALYDVGVVVGPSAIPPGMQGDKARACGCENGGTSGGMGLLLLALMGLQRRRREK